MADIILKKILIVDDKQDVRKLLCEILSEIGYAVDMSENGKYAMQMLEKGSYDLIVSDVNMPEMDGMNFYRVLSENLPDMKDKILFMTGNPNGEVVSFFKEHGCKFIVKPDLFGEAGLLKQIKRMLDK